MSDSDLGLSHVMSSSSLLSDSDPYLPPLCWCRSVEARVAPQCGSIEGCA